MLFIYRLLVVGLLSVGIAAATTAQAGTQLFEGSWIIKAFGNEITTGTGESGYYQNSGIPQGAQCNNYIPRCPFTSTPILSAMGNKWGPLAGTLTGVSPFCTPWASWDGGSATMRPAKGATAKTTMFGGLIPPLYRNPQFFSSGGAPNATSCSAASTVSGGPGIVQKGYPVIGTFTAITTGNQLGGFNFGKAPATGSVGLRVTGLVGEFAASYPYIYSYTYATLRNGVGTFGPNYGPGSFTVAHTYGAVPVAKIQVKQGANKFGGTMEMLGALTTKACYYSANGCWLGGNDWKYNVAGASGAMTSAGVVIAGYITTYTAVYYHTGLMTPSTFIGVGSRFPWTTGTITVTAKGRGPHKTVHTEHGYDNRNTTTPYGKGTIQMVTPLITKWFGIENYETGGIGILRIKFIPEPQTWAMLLAGASLIAVGHRMRGR